MPVGSCSGRDGDKARLTHDVQLMYILLTIPIQLLMSVLRIPSLIITVFRLNVLVKKANVLSTLKKIPSPLQTLDEKVEFVVLVWLKLKATNIFWHLCISEKGII